MQGGGLRYKPDSRLIPALGNAQFMCLGYWTLDAINGIYSSLLWEREITRTNILNGPYLYKWLLKHFIIGILARVPLCLMCKLPILFILCFYYVYTTGMTKYGRETFAWHLFCKGNSRRRVVFWSRSNNTKMRACWLLWLTSSLLTSFFFIAFWAAALVATRSPSAASLSLCCWSSFSG